MRFLGLKCHHKAFPFGLETRSSSDASLNQVFIPFKNGTHSKSTMLDRW